MQSVIRLLVSAVFIAAATATLSQTQREVLTAKGSETTATTPHPLSWWTKHPLRLDSDGELMIGNPKLPGRVPASHYAFKLKVTTLGTLSGHKIVQVITSIYPRNEVVASGWSNVGDSDTQWKSLLVQTSAEEYVELCRVQSSGVYDLPLKPAAVYGSGLNTILVTNDPLSGNGALCTDGYWWFDEAGAHPVDFSPLLQAINHATPRKTTYTSNCWALNPARFELKAGIQRADAECHACGWIGEVRARYKIEHGKALPVEVHFTPEEAR